MFKKFKMMLAVIAATAASAFGTAQFYASKAEMSVEAWKLANLAQFVETCPYQKTSGYKRAWNLVYPYDVAVWWFAKNQAQYYPELTEELAKQCFTAPVKS